MDHTILMYLDLMLVVLNYVQSVSACPGILRCDFWESPWRLWLMERGREEGILNM